MAENEVQILITAVDEATGTLKNIEKELGTTNKAVQKSNVALTRSFKDVQGAMLNLGQVAQGIHNIFETQERATRNLENAQDRLENATIRLQNAQEELLQVSRNHERNQLDVEKATLANKRAQEELAKYTERLAGGIDGFVGETLQDYEDAQIAAKEAALDLADAQQKVADEASELSKKQDAVIISSNNVDRATRGLAKAYQDSRWAYVDMGVQAISVAGNMAMLLNVVGPLVGIGGLGGMGAAAVSAAEGTTVLTTSATGLTTAVGTGGLAATVGAAGAIVGLLILLNKIGEGAEVNAANKKLEEQIATLDALKDSAHAADRELANLLEQQMRLEAYQKKTASGQYGGKTTVSPEPKKYTGPTYEQLNPNTKSIISVKDAIVKPNGQVIQTDPQDTIYAMKNGMPGGGGITIIIKDNNIYGTDPDEIADALNRKLKNMIMV